VDSIIDGINRQVTEAASVGDQMWRNKRGVEVHNEIERARQLAMGGCRCCWTQERRDRLAAVIRRLFGEVFFIPGYAVEDNDPQAWIGKML